jgi:hypothetical protein
VVSQTERFFIFMVRSEGEWKVTTTAKTYAWGLSTQKQQVDRIVEEDKDIFSLPTGVTLHYQVKHSIDLALNDPLNNIPMYRCSVMENEEMKHHIQDIIMKDHIKPISSPYGSPIFWYGRMRHGNFLLIT